MDYCITINYHYTRSYLCICLFPLALLLDMEAEKS